MLTHPATVLLTCSALLIFVCGCETSGSRPPGVTDEMPLAQEINTRASSKKSQAATPPPPPASAPSSGGGNEKESASQIAAEAARANSALDEAIRSQSDEKIKDVAERMLSANSSDIKALNALAMYYYKKGRFDASKYLLNKAVSINPNVGPVYSNLGLVHLALNEEREAIRNFKKAVALDEGDPVSSANLGSIYAQNHDYAKAVLVLETAVRKGIQDSKVLNNYGLALMGTGKYEMAEQQFKKSLKDSNSQRETLFNLAILLIEHLSKRDEGMDVLNRLKFIGPSEDMKNKIKDLENKAKAGVQ